MRARRVLRTTIVIGVAVMALAAPAFADGQGGSGYAWAETGDGSATVGAEEAVNPTGDPSQSGTVSSPCTWTPVEADLIGDATELLLTRMPHGEYAWFLRECTNPDGSVSSTYISVEVTEETPAPDPEELRASAQEQLQLPAPEVAMSPPGDQVVHVASWLWLDDAIWRPHSSSASAGGVTATVTAIPVRTLWDMGTGDVVTCDGPGDAYAAGRPDAGQSSGCSYTYRNSSAGRPGNAYPLTVTVEWQVSWTVTGAPGGGELPGLTTSTSTAVPVGEVQALND